MGITSAARLKAVLGIPAGLTFHDTLLGMVATAADARVLAAIGQGSLAVCTVQEYPLVYDEGQVAVQLRHVPVVGMVAVTNDGALVATSEYRLDTETGDLRLLDGEGYWSTEREGAAVMYGYGYTEATIPPQLVAAADILGVAMFNRGKHAGLSATSASGYSTTLASTPIPPEVQAILARYEDAHH